MSYRLFASVLLAAGLVIVGVLGISNMHGTAVEHSLPSVGGDHAAGAELTLAPTQPELEFARGAIGLSIETNELATRDLSARHGSLVALMRQLGPGVLRIGGNSVDWSWWTSTYEPRPAWATSIVNPTDLRRLNRLLAATGWKAILGVDLGHFDPARAADESRIADSLLGSRLLGIEIGNEPNDYGNRLVKLRPSSYSVYNYLSEVATYTPVLRVAAPGVSLFGPDLSSAPSARAWLPVIAASKQTPFVALTEHYYSTAFSRANGACRGTPVPSALELLSPKVRESENIMLQGLVSAGQLGHLESRISETNTTSSCDTAGGPATSPVFASALWAVDWALRSASAGVGSLNFHGRFGRCSPETFSPICEPGSVAADRGGPTARPEYYGLLAASELEGGRFIPITGQAQSDSDDFTAYATLHPSGTITLAIDNFATGGSTSVVVNVPGYVKASAETLVGPSISATGGVRLGRATVGMKGLLHPHRTTISGSNGSFRLTIAGTSAIVLTLSRS